MEDTPVGSQKEGSQPVRNRGPGVLVGLGEQLLAAVVVEGVLDRPDVRRVDLQRQVEEHLVGGGGRVARPAHHLWGDGKRLVLQSTPGAIACTRTPQPP